MQRLGGTGGGRNDVQRGSASAAQILVRKIKRDLIVGEAVNRVHQARNDTEVIEQHLGQRSQAIGGAGCIRNNVVLSSVIFIFIHAQNDGDVFVRCRGRDDDLLDRALHVRLGLGGVGKVTGGFNHDLCADGAPI